MQVLRIFFVKSGKKEKKQKENPPKTLDMDKDQLKELMNRDNDFLEF